MVGERSTADHALARIEFAHGVGVLLKTRVAAAGSAAYRASLLLHRSCSLRWYEVHRHAEEEP
jgi:hypothetical protein